nr:F-box/FBD/LRR-repeat protein At1g13570-like [Ipomoea trifida]
MAQRRRIKTLPDSSSDLISHLPVEIKDRILERLPIRDAARTALLSTHWNDAWLQHGRLAFDSKFFWRFGKSKVGPHTHKYSIIWEQVLKRKLRKPPVRSGFYDMESSPNESQKIRSGFYDISTRSRNFNLKTKITCAIDQQRTRSFSTLNKEHFLMAQRGQIKTVVDASRDLISHLPVEVKDRILECLPTRDAARTALLSTHWNDAWLRHGRLAFDLNFFRRFIESKGYSLVPFVKIITCILLQRVQPVKKFSLVIAALKSLDRKLEQFDLDQWFLFLSRNGVEELCITHGGGEYKGDQVPMGVVVLPSCISKSTNCHQGQRLCLRACWFNHA